MSVVGVVGLRHPSAHGTLPLARWLRLTRTEATLQVWHIGPNKLANTVIDILEFVGVQVCRHSNPLMKTSERKRSHRHPEVRRRSLRFSTELLQ